MGIALIIDELQSLKARALGDLIYLVSTLRDEIPLAFIGGGLTYLPAKIAKVATSTERLRFEPTDFLPASDARRGISEPAHDEGVSWDAEALERVVTLAQGYPYFLQLYASEAWAAANRRGPFDAVTTDEVERAVPEVDRQLEIGLYGSRFEKLGPKQREYVFAMEELMHPKADLPRSTVRSGEVARLLEKSLTDVSPVRDGLIRSGTVHSPAHGDLEFSVPGFADYVARRRAADRP